MKKYYILSLSFLALLSCSEEQYTVIVDNSTTVERVGEVVELELDVDDPDSYALFDASGDQIEVQTTYEGNIIFQSTVAPKSSVEYTLRRADRVAVDTVAIGRLYRDRKDDVAWENDKIGFRTYSKQAGKSGDKLYGYDVFTKRVEKPVLDLLYSVENNPHDRALIQQLRAKGKHKEAQTLYDIISYHYDHGQGMDYYVVGATLGCGTAALLEGGEIVYPTFYDKFEILDAGGLRFSFRLTYDPVEIGGDMVTEVRTITLDAGTHFNHVEVEYKGLTKPRDVVAGIVLHDTCEVSSVGAGYAAYAEPVHIYGWQTYNAILFDEDMKVRVELFDKPRGAAHGHILSQGSYLPNQTLSYYMGAGWNRWGFTSPEQWFEYVEKQKQRVSEPLSYKIIKR